MTVATTRPEHDAPAATPRGPSKRRPVRRRTSLFAHGEPMVWLTGGTLVLCLVMIAGLLGLVLYFGTSTFWPQPVTRMELADGTALLGEVSKTETYEPAPSSWSA